MACSLSKFGECNPKKSAISIVRDEFERYEYAIVCMQCEDAPCLEVCHQGAYYVEDRIVKREDDKCIHCRLCAAVCPHSAISTIGRELVKCDLCGGDPQCVKFCSTEALVYEEETKELSQRRKELAKKILLTS